jgi:hypothetical protein
MKTAILTAAMMILMTAANAIPFADTSNYFSAPDKAFQATVTWIDNNLVKLAFTNPDEGTVVLKVYNDDMVKVYQRKVYRVGTGLRIYSCCYSRHN